MKRKNTKKAENKSCPKQTALPAENTQNTEKPEAKTTDPPKAAAQETVSGILKCKNKAADLCGLLGIPEMLLMRFIGIFMLVSAVQMRILGFRKESPISPVDAWKDYVGASSLPMLIFWMILGFAALSMLYIWLPQRLKFFDQLSLLGGTLFFGITMMWGKDNVYTCLGMTAVAIVFTVYAVSKLRNEQLEKIPFWAACTAVFAIAAGICTFVAVTSIAHHRTFGTSTFDFGIFVQMFHSLANDFTAVTSCERDKFLSHFYVHSSYIYYLLMPFYALIPNENTLLAAQAILAMGGVIPFFLILKNHGFKGGTQIAASFLYIFCAGILNPCYYDFHENAFLPTVLMWLLYAADTKKIWLFYIMSVLTCSVKEDAPLYVMCIALFFFFEEKTYKKLHYLVVLLLSLSYFVFITNWLTKNGDGSMMASSRFGNLTIRAEDGFGGIVRNVLTDPAYFFSLFFTEESLIFFLQVLVPLAFLPFMTKHIHRYLLMIPFIIMNLVVGENYGYACKIGFQYIFGPACLLVYIAIRNAADFDAEKRNRFVFAAASASVIMLTSLISGKNAYYTRYVKNKEHYQQMEECLDSVPKDASVASNTWYLPHMADRNEIYILDGNDLYTDPADETKKTMINPYRCDFYVMSPNDENTPYFLKDLEASGYLPYNELPGSIIIYVSPIYQTN